MVAVDVRVVVLRACVGSVFQLGVIGIFLWELLSQVANILARVRGFPMPMPRKAKSRRNQHVEAPARVLQFPSAMK